MRLALLRLAMAELRQFQGVVSGDPDEPQGRKLSTATRDQQSVDEFDAVIPLIAGEFLNRHPSRANPTNPKS